MKKSNFKISNRKVWVTGPNGMVGKSLINFLKKRNIRLLSPDRKTLNLLDQKKVSIWIKKNKPDLVIMTAAKVGGIFANDNYPADFIYENLQIQNNIINSSRQNNVKKLIFIGSSCIYPRNCKQPIKEKYLLSGKLESTNQWYAIAKIAGIKLVQSCRKQYGCNYVSVMPTNMYGPNDNFDDKNSHVLAALVKKFCLAKVHNKKEVVVWGTGKPLREFLHVDDFSRALIHVSENYNEEEPINIGSNEEISIINLAKMISKILKYKGKIVLDKNFPDGTPRKILDSSRINRIGWKPKIKLKNGIKKMIKQYINENFNNSSDKR